MPGIPCGGGHKNPRKQCVVVSKKWAGKDLNENSAPLSLKIVRKIAKTKMGGKTMKMKQCDLAQKPHKRPNQKRAGKDENNIETKMDRKS